MSAPPALLEVLRPLQELLVDLVVAGPEQAGRLDLERSRRFLRLLEAALGRSDLLPELERLIHAPAKPPGG